MKFSHATALALMGEYLMVPIHYVGQQKVGGEYTSQNPK